MLKFTGKKIFCLSKPVIYVKNMDRFCSVFFSKIEKCTLQHAGVCILPASGFPQALEIMENLENHERKFHAWKNHGI